MLDAPLAPKTTTAMTQKLPIPQALLRFVHTSLEKNSIIDTPATITLTPLSGDAGFRQYFRVNTQPPLLAVQAPIGADQSESAVHFAKLSHKLIKQGVPTPQVLALDAEQNLMLIEDMGERLLIDELDDDSAGLLYGEALMALARLQQIPREHINTDDYNTAELHEEMGFFNTWFVDALLKYSPTFEQTQIIRNTFDFLTEQALAQPQTLVHRDYHSRNLRDNKPGYLTDLPLVLRYTIEIAEKYNETRPFADLIKQDLLPQIEKQHWYRAYQSAGD